MSMLTYVEDYIEFMAGYRDVTGVLRGMFNAAPYPIQLARYDTGVISSLADQTLSYKRAYTDKQSKLAVKLIRNYSRQLAQHCVIVPKELDKFRFGVRIIDESRRVYIRDQRLIVKFPYNTDLIAIIKRWVSTGNGSSSFNPVTKEWELALTESAVNWACTIGIQNQFEIDPAVAELFESIIQVESQPYAIELVSDGDGYSITNATDSLKAHVADRLGGFGGSNLIALVDNAPVCGYDISKPIMDDLTVISPELFQLLTNRITKLKRAEYKLEQIIEYASMVNRLPIHVYDTGLPKEDTDAIVYLNRKGPLNIKPKLLVTMSNLMVGSKKQGWLTNAEKVVILE